MVDLDESESSLIDRSYSSDEDSSDEEASVSVYTHEEEKKSS